MKQAFLDQLYKSLPALTLLALAACGGSASPSVTLMQSQNPVGSNLTQISFDPYTVAPGQHATEVEPHMIANGSTLVAAFQTGRIDLGGATDIGWATSSDGGATWSHGFLPGLTTGEGTGPYDAASDPAVAYDAAHGVWMIASLPISNSGLVPAVVVNRAIDDGFTWEPPLSADTSSLSSDKNWIVCDSWLSSPNYGNCYLQWDDPLNQGQILMSTSSDGGQTWGPALPTASQSDGIGGQPLVQPNGTVVVPIEIIVSHAAFMEVYLSSDGGGTWSAPVTISNIQFHADAGGIRSSPLPSAAVDGAGNVWVVWEDCRFRSNCSTNDLVYSTSADGLNWSAVTRIPIDDVSTSVDHFIPGIGIDPATSGATAHVGLHYYYYSNSNCTVSTCQLFVGYISSANGGSSWNAPSTLTAAPMQLGWLPNSQNGLMVGDYIATAFANGVPHGVFAVAQANSGTIFKEAIYTAQGLSAASQSRQFSSAGDLVLHHKSDEIEKEIPERGRRTSQPIELNQR